jgi:LCP family protein required for cell wall assembly
MLQQLNRQVAANQPFAAPAARPTNSPAPIAAPLKRRHGLRFYLLASLTVTCLIGGSALAYAIHSSLNNKFSAASIVVSATKAIVEKTPPLAGQAQGRTNFLIYGMTEDGMRTDSIMLASYYYQQHKLVTLNIPRDLYVNDGYENCKFGEVYAYAKLREPKNPNYPNQFVANLVSKEYGIPVNYWVELNMQGEVDLVNSVGGINVDVPDSFTDYEYPTWDYSGYVRPAPHFNAGWQHMDGATALIYSRSRHSLDNNEGSDFARSKRQAIVLSSIMTKVKSQGILGNLAQLSQYLSIVNKDVTTDMSTDQMMTAAKLVKGLNPNTDHLIGNWSSGNGFLCDAQTTAGADIVLYGVTGDCETEAGGATTSSDSSDTPDTDSSSSPDYYSDSVESVYGNDSVYRQDAISYVQNLLQSVEPPPAPAPAAGSTSSTGSSASSTTTATPTTSSP